MKILRRGQYLLLTGLTAQGFVSLVRRGQVPLLGDWRDGQEAGTRVGYLDNEALMMVVADQLSRDGKMDRGLAARLVSESPECIIEGRKIAERTATPIWIAYVEEGEIQFWSSKFGPVADICVELLEDADASAAARNMAWVNLSACLKILLDRAQEHGIDLSGGEN